MELRSDLIHKIAAGVPIANRRGGFLGGRGLSVQHKKIRPLTDVNTSASHKNVVDWFLQRIRIRLQPS